MSGSPFASSGVTAADIQDIQKRLNEIEKKIVDGFTGVSNKILSNESNTECFIALLKFKTILFQFSEFILGSTHV